MRGSLLRPIAAHWRIAVVVLIATLGRLAVVLVNPPGGLYSDMAHYDRIARHLLAGTLGPSDTFLPVGYPAFLATLYALGGRSLFLVGAVQAVLGGLTCLLTGLVARRAGASEKVALGAAIVVAVYPPLIYYGDMVLTEALAPFCWTLTVWLLLRAVDWPGYVWSGIAGFSLSMAILVRSNFVLMCPFVALFAWVACRPNTRRGVGVAATVIACTLPLLLVAAGNNSRLLGRLAGLSTNGAMNFLMLHGDYRTFEAPDATWTPVRNYLRYRDTYFSPVASYDEAFLYQEGWSFFLERSDKIRHTLSNLAEGFGLGLQGYWPGNRLGPDEPSERTWARSLLRYSSRAYVWLVVVPLVVECSISCFRRRMLRPPEAPLLLAATMVVVLVVTVITFLADPRVHVPFDPVLIAVALARGDFSRQ